MTNSKIFLFFCLCFIFGVFTGSIVFIFQIMILGFAIFGLILISVFYPRKNIAVFGFCLIIFALGAWRANSAEISAINNDFVENKLYGKEIILEARVSKEPDIRGRSVKLVVDDAITKEIAVQGKILITAARYPEYKYGDRIKISGKLEIPPMAEDFNYKRYLEKDGIYAVMSFPKIEKINGLRRASAIYNFILAIKDKLRKSIQANFSPPQSLVLEGMILGDNGAMTDDLKNKLNITGLRHIIAISGTHIVILSQILMIFLLGLGLWRGQAFYFTIVFVSIYIVLTGLPASGVRAGIMGGLLLLGQKIGRKSASFRLMAMAGAIMVLINPLILIRDVGFQLSFLASMGMIYLSPFFENWLKFLPKIFNIRSMASATFAAQIFTLPILIYNFGNISLIAPITNFLILPSVSFLMIFGFISGFVGIFSNLLGWLVSFPTWIFLTYFVKIIDIFSQSWAIKTISNVNWLWLVVAYLLLGYFSWRINQKKKLKFLNY